MALLAVSKEIPRGEYVVAQEIEGEFYHLLQCTPELAYAFFAQAKIKELRHLGQESYIVIHPDDLTSGYWGFTSAPPEEEDEKDFDYDV